MPRRVNISYENSSLNVPATLICAILATLVLGLCGWLWMLHQRTDAIPVIQVEVNHIKSSVERLENWAGTTPKQAQAPGQVQPVDAVAKH